ncbi:MAG: histidinol-phosphate transaminase [Pseudomonadota bacterium]|nr:histidinol-phosphate transaminase [Pseudomonadota bacterium]
MENINPRVLELAPYQPGKPIEELSRELGIGDAIKLASNENPRGPGVGVRQALTDAISGLSRYPDSTGYRLKRILADRLDVEEAQITLGNGSNDVLELAARVALSTGSVGVVDEYCFLVYPLAITAAHGKVRRVSAVDWGHDLDGMAAAIDSATRIVYIANPNNPTGTWVSRNDLAKFLNRVPERVWVVLDEAYFEYVDRKGYPDGVKMLADYPNLIVTRTFSKIHGLAAMRIGYSITSAAFADLMNRIRQPFNVNTLALAAAEAALNDGDFVVNSRKLNASGMDYLVGGLSSLGYSTISSVGNFISFECGKASQAIYEGLLKRGVIVRPLGNYGMDEHLRVTIGLPDENARFLDALSQVS